MRENIGRRKRLPHFAPRYLRDLWGKRFRLPSRSVK
jgi:hypothetical protein